MEDEEEKKSLIFCKHENLGISVFLLCCYWDGLRPFNFLSVASGLYLVSSRKL